MSESKQAATPTWRDVAALYASTIQEYVQQNGPLPDGPITPEAWALFRAWAAEADRGPHQDAGSGSGDPA